MLAIRAVLWFLALPAVVAGVVPALLTRGNAPDAPNFGPGVTLLSTGVLLLIWCVRDFLVSGRGTLAPWDPPKHLVVVGLYRFVRNPMYLAVLTTVTGWAVLFWSGLVAAYAIALAIAFHLRVILGEEPWLDRRFGAGWRHYAGTTGRWIPRMHRRRDGGDRSGQPREKGPPDTG